MKVLVWMCNLLYWLGVALMVGSLAVYMLAMLLLTLSKAEQDEWFSWGILVCCIGTALAFVFNPSWRPFGIGRSSHQPL